MTPADRPDSERERIADVISRNVMGQSIDNYDEALSLADAILDAARAAAPQAQDDLVPTRGTTAIVDAWNELPDKLRVDPHLTKLFEAVKGCRDVAAPERADDRVRQEAILRAADILSFEAECLAQSNTVGGDGVTWAEDTDLEKADHDEMLAVAAELRQGAA